jgi:hypothetical protein
MVMPVRMLMSNLPAKASLIPPSLRMGYAPCGLQLKFLVRGREGLAQYAKNNNEPCVPQQDNIGLLHRRNIFPDSDFDSISSRNRAKFLAQTPRAFFALYAGDEARWYCRVIALCDGGGGGSGSVGLPFGPTGI